MTTHPISEQEVGRRFACHAIELMKWQKTGTMFHCTGCPSACGTSDARLFQAQAQGEFLSITGAKE